MSEKQALNIVYRNGDSETLRARPVGGFHFVLEESSITSVFCKDPAEAGFWQDTIEVEPLQDGRVRFVRIVERSGRDVQLWILPQDVFECSALNELLSRIVQLNGNWERIFGGVLITHLPKSAGLDVRSELDKLRATHRAGTL